VMSEDDYGLCGKNEGSEMTVVLLKEISRYSFFGLREVETAPVISRLKQGAFHIQVTHIEQS
jgi:hypothetical protein